MGYSKEVEGRDEMKTIELSDGIVQLRNKLNTSFLHHCRRRKREELLCFPHLLPWREVTGLSIHRTMDSMNQSIGQVAKIVGCENA